MSDRPNKYRIIVRAAPTHFLKRVYVPQKQRWAYPPGDPAPFWEDLNEGCTDRQEARTICELDANPDRVVAEFTL